jgi:large subunit ribosomal protein L13
MNTLSYKTISATKESADKQWLLIDAEGEVLGRLASKVANLLRGKHKTCFTPHADCGDYVIVINAEKVRLTGKKMAEKQYIHHTGHPGGQRSRTPRQLLVSRPHAIVEEAVRGMLPKNILGAAIFRNLHVVVGPEHNHEAQKPKTIKFNEIK